MLPSAYGLPPQADPPLAEKCFSLAVPMGRLWNAGRVV